MLYPSTIAQIFIVIQSISFKQWCDGGGSPWRSKHLNPILLFIFHIITIIIFSVDSTSIAFSHSFTISIWLVTNGTSPMIPLAHSDGMEKNSNKLCSTLGGTMYSHHHIGSMKISCCHHAVVEGNQGRSYKKCGYCVKATFGVIYSIFVFDSRMGWKLISMVESWCI